MKKEYNIQRELGEYITYSAHLSDYLFTSSINSSIHQSPLMKKWNSNDKNGWGEHSSFPGFLVFFLGLAGIFVLIKDKNEISLNLKLDRQKSFFISVMLLGFIFSLGPRLNFNGQYAFIPMPYTLALKFVPFIDATRAPARWSFLFFFGLTFFALVGLDKITPRKYQTFLLSSCFLIFILEYVPLNLTSFAGSYTDSRDNVLKELCADKKEVVLELPVTHLTAGTNIADGLSYITKTQLASTYHGCFIINGYSGYDIPENFELGNRLEGYIEANDPNQFVNELKNRNITIVKFNPSYFNLTKQPAVDQFFKTLANVESVRKIDTTIFAISNNP